MGRWNYWGKTEADGLLKIDMAELKKFGFLGGMCSSSLTWTNSSTGNKNNVAIEVDTQEHMYARIKYTQTNWDTEEKKDFDYKVPIVTTSCHYGGQRYWFICPLYKSNVYCGRRVRVLYKGGDYFGCRYCYDLSYYSRKLDRHSLLSNILMLDDKIEKLETKIKRLYYRGYPTKKYRKLLRLQNRELAGMESYTRIKGL